MRKFVPATIFTLVAAFAFAEPAESSSATEEVVAEVVVEGEAAQEAEEGAEGEVADAELADAADELLLKAKTANKQ